QQLKAARANKHAKHANYENLDDHIWSDNNIDERSSDYFAVLLTAGSKRTQRRKKAELKKAAQNTRPITAYLPPALTSSNVASALTSTFGLSTELCASTEVESIGSESMEVESIEVELVESMEVELVESMKTELVKLMETELVESLEAELVKPTADASAEIDKKTTMRLAIEELDGLLKKNNNQINKGVRVRLQASLQYLRLRYYHDQTKIRASTTIWRKLPKDNRGKFTKVSSLLDDERISMKTNSFLPMMKELDLVLLEYDDQDLTKLVEKSILPEKKKHCVITHDETTLAANDDKKTGWGPKGEHKLRQKGQGRCIHVSEFLCEPLGRVHLTEEQHAAHPEISKCYVTELLEIGANYEDYWNEVMTERGIWDKRLRGKCVKCSKDETKICCNKRKLARQPDFMKQKNVLEEIVLKRGLRKTVPEAFNSVDIITIKKFARKAWRYMDAYRKGLTPSAAEFVVKKYKSHRRIPENIEL
ncbi:12154_t:CDS:2, partial [Cetraspora pellucida]